MFAVGFIGQSGTGKTTLMEKVVARLVSRGRRVSAVKSTHHDTDIDQPGKDSWRFRKAGANEVILAGKDRWALMKETPEAEVPLSELLKRLEPADIVMVEGFKADASIPRILVWRNRPEAEPLRSKKGWSRSQPTTKRWCSPKASRGLTSTAPALLPTSSLP